MFDPTIDLPKRQTEMRRRHARFSQTKHGRVGMTSVLYAEVVRSRDDANGHACEICDAPASELPRGLCTDHCHTSLTFRGRLCDRCNVGLGMFRDSPDLLVRAAEYLTDFETSFT